jgi:hypothetical protein
VYDGVCRPVPNLRGPVAPQCPLRAGPDLARSRAEPHQLVVDVPLVETAGQNVKAAAQWIRSALGNLVAAHHPLHLRSQPPHFELQNAIKQRYRR